MVTLIDHTDPITFEELRSLAELDGTWVTLAMPSHRTGPEVRQDRIRFGNLAAEAVRQLGLLTDTETANKIKVGLDEIAGDLDFWRSQTGGLVIFAGTEYDHVFRLPHAIPEGVLVADIPAVGILVPYVAEETRFRVLALSTDSVRLLEGTLNSMVELDLGPVPATYGDAFEHKEQQHQLQHQSRPDGSAFHGHGGDSRPVEDAAVRYFRVVDAALTERLRDEPDAPLVLASVTANIAQFRELSNQRGLLDDAVTGNHDKTPLHELHQLTWPLVEASHRLPLTIAHDQLKQAIGRREAIVGSREIAAAARTGRIAAMFVDADAAEPDTDVERAIREVLLTSGEVHAVSGLDPAPAALTRY